MVFTGAFWKAAAERAIKSFTYSLLATLGAGSLDIVSMPWFSGARIAAGAAVLSVLGSIVSSATTGGGPSITNAEKLDEPGSLDD